MADMAIAAQPVLIVNLQEHCVTLNGQEIELTSAAQMTLLATMARSPRRVYTTAELLEALWGGCGREVSSNTVAAHLSNLRQVLGRPEGWLTNRMRVGYQLAPRGASVEIVERS